MVVDVIFVVGGGGVAVIAVIMIIDSKRKKRNEMFFGAKTNAAMRTCDVEQCRLDDAAKGV